MDSLASIYAPNDSKEDLKELSLAGCCEATAAELINVFEMIKEESARKLGFQMVRQKGSHAG